MARAIGAPLTNTSADHGRALQLAFERCATPLTMGTAILLRCRRACAVAYHLAHLPGSPALLRASVVASREV